MMPSKSHSQLHDVAIYHIKTVQALASFYLSAFANSFVLFINEDL